MDNFFVSIPLRGKGMRKASTVSWLLQTSRVSIPLRGKGMRKEILCVVFSDLEHSFNPLAG